ncbi:MAG: DUF4358 domain-containing protein, partial [Lachnospiraceae bacterium]|nr:DUF4358 domain-containing protein [Lachnospiraceae bacterium]
MNTKDIKLYILIAIMGVCLIPIFLLYNTHHKMISVDIEKVSDNIIKNFDSVEKDNKDMLYTDFNIDKEKNMISKYIYYHPLDNMLVEEYLVIKLNDMSDAPYIKKAINNHIENRK